MTGDRPSADERALVASALAGDEGALGRLLGLHQQSAYNVAYRLLGSEADARDAVQEAFLLTVRAVRGERAPPRDTARFEPWLRRVVANAALGQLRRRPSFRPGPPDEIATPPASGEYGDPARAAERREARGDVLRALLALPDAQRAALALREYEGLSYDEIAAILGVSRGAVERLLFRARHGFRDAYEGLMVNARPVGCPEFASLLSVAADHELGGTALQDLNAHVDRCQDCRRDLDGLRRARRLAALVPLLAAPAGWNPVAATIPHAAPAAADAAHSAVVGNPGSLSPTSGLGGSVGATATGPAAGSGAPAAPKAVGASVLTKLTGVTGAKAAVVAVATTVTVAVTAASLVPTATPPAASPTAATPLPPAGASPAAASPPAAGSPVASPSTAGPPAATPLPVILTPPPGATATAAVSTPSGTPSAVATAAR